jgi:leucyl aminopeptidase
MKKIDIYFINSINEDCCVIDIKVDSVKVNLYIGDLSNYKLLKELDKVNKLLSIYSNLKRINIIFDKNIDENKILSLLTKLHDIMYKYYNNTNEIKLYNVTEKVNLFMQELTNYKNIVMDPNKTPTSYLKWILSNIPSNYMYNLFESSDEFPLLKCVAIGSDKPFYFLHIYPNKINQDKKDIFLVGKAVTYDSGGLNLKSDGMNEMKIDMIGSAILIAVLRILSESKNNINILIPIVENMIGPHATKPGSVVKSKLGKNVEITNIDAEGRLCLADCFEYVESKLVKDRTNSIMIDIATLTGNTMAITCCVSGISMSNNMGSLYNKEIIKIGEKIGEYVDYLKLHEEYNDMLKSNVADLKNINEKTRAGCIVGGVFLNNFVKNIPWIHLDVANVTYKNEMVTSYGVNLLYQFLQKID